MATLEQVEDAIRKAHAKGNKELVRKLGEVRKQMLAGGGGAPAGPAEGTDEQGWAQRLFDLRNANTGESLIYGNKPKPSGFDDVTRIMADTATRGFGDKITGTGNLTDAARERTPGYVEAPADITAALASSPYRVGSTLAGGVAGGLEGAASAYGHQDGWIPDTGAEWGDIAKEAGKGMVLGSGAAKAGEWIGKGVNALKGKPAISTAEELLEAGGKVEKRVDAGKNVSKKNRDILARTKRMKAAELAAAEGKGGFQKMFEGMDRPMTEAERVFGGGKDRIQWPHDEQKIIAELANKPNKTAKVLSGVGSMASGGNFMGSIPIAKYTKGLGPVVGAGFKMAASLADDIDPKTVEKLKSMILDNTGRLKADKATIDMMRDQLAKAGISQKRRMPPRGAR